MLGKLEVSRRSNRHPCSRRNVIEDLRNVDAVGDIGKVLDQAGLRGFVVIRRDLQQRVGADAFGVLRELQRIRGVVGAGARDDRNSAGNLLDAEADALFVFGIVERSGFAGRTADRDAVGAAGDLEFDQFRKLGVIDRIIIMKRSHDSNAGSGKYWLFHVLQTCPPNVPANKPLSSNAMPNARLQHSRAATARFIIRFRRFF